MIGQEFKIIFIENKAHLTPNKSLVFELLGISTIKKFKSPAFWRVKITKLIESEQRLVLEVLEYTQGTTNFTSFDNTMLMKLEAVNIISFPKGINTDWLLQCAYGGLPTEYKPQLLKRHYTQEEINIPQKNDTSNYNTIPQYVVPKPQKIMINESFFVPIKDVDFKSGSVSFIKKFKECNRTFEIRIDNEDIREEYDAVKNYFSQVLKTKKIKVFVLIELSDNDLVSCNATSPEIDKINKDFIEDVKYNYFSAIKKKNSPEALEKSVFTVSEYLDTFAADTLKSNPFYDNDAQFFEDNLKVSNSKHYRQLRFLSSKHSHHLTKLRIVHQPFSFVFLFEGDNSNYFVWETLDTKEATYIWRVGKENDLGQKLLSLNRIIKIIQTDGKNSYIKSNEDDLKRIFHDYSDINSGFIIWKDELEKLLI
jgi:hypothetical protein